MISTVGTFNLIEKLYLSISLFIPPLIKVPFLTGYDYHAGYRIKIKLICRSTKGQALISISKIQKFTALIM